MILVMFNDSEGSFPPVARDEGRGEAPCEDLSLGLYDGTCDDEEDSDETK